MRDYGASRRLNQLQLHLFWGASLPARAIRVPHAACAGAAAHLSPRDGDEASVGLAALGGLRARVLREFVMTNGVGSGALGLRSLLHILGRPRACAVGAERRH